MPIGKRIASWALLVPTCVFAARALGAAPSAISSPVAYNGHTYVLLGNSNWTDAEQAAQAMGGHLTTVNNQAENDFLFNTFESYGGVPRALWTGLYDPTGIAHDDGSGGLGSQHAANFVWVSGAPVTFTNWIAGEPNNEGNEYYGYIETGYNGSWNDLANSLSDGAPSTLYGVVEIVPEPASLGLLGAGLIAGLVRPRRRTQ